MGRGTVGGLLATLLLAGCASGGTPVPDAAAPQTANLDMTGRWTLAAPNAPTCGMNFEPGPSQQQGVIRPEGGCPGDFFMSRHWALAQGQLTINDHKNEPLAHLKLTGTRFAGQSTAGMPVTLSR